MNELADKQITIVGLGLMGGSLGGALRGRCRTVVGVARRAESIEKAVGQGLIDRGTTELAEGVAQADIVVLATPVRVILRQIAEIGPLLPQGCLLMDLGSTKADIVAAMADLPPHIQPLGGHPMCGKENSSSFSGFILYISLSCSTYFEKYTMCLPLQLSRGIKFVCSTIPVKGTSGSFILSQ